MSLRLCIECGASPSRRAARTAPCARCGAAAPVWKPVPVTFLGLVRRLLAAVVLLGSGAACAGTIYVLCSEWAYPSWPGRFLQVVLAAILVVFGSLAAFVLVQMGLTQLFYRDHRHDQAEGERRGTARTVLGWLVRGEGRGVRAGEPFLPAAPSLEALPVFAGTREVSRQVGRALRMAYHPKAVDTAILVALLGLASRGRCELVVRTARGWVKPEGEKMRPSPPHHTVLVRRSLRGREPPLETGWLESALLAALDAMAGSPAPAGAGLGPYRAGVVISAPEQAEPPVLVEALIGALTGRRAHARAWLVSVLRAEAKRGGADRRISPEDAEHLGAELAAVFRTGPRGQGPAWALLAQIQASFAGRQAAPPAS